MEYRDRVYGDCTIDEPLVLELMQSPAFQRLKGIDQAGYAEPFFPGTSHSRFEHSIGVFLLLRAYGARSEEQVAGLLHDVSHTVFSHCIDYAQLGGSESEHTFQDDAMASYVERTDIPRILERHGMTVDQVLDDSRHPLKETQLPLLCADRIDYPLRMALAYRVIGEAAAHKLLNHLKVEGLSWVFDSLSSAQGFAHLFLGLNQKYLAGFESAVMFRTVGDYLMHGLTHGYITVDDLYTTDRAVLDKINMHTADDMRLELLWERMNNKLRYWDDPTNYETMVTCKSRVVDPRFAAPKGIMLLSDADVSWKRLMAAEQQPKKYFLRFER